MITKAATSTRSSVFCLAYYFMMACTALMLSSRLYAASALEQLAASMAPGTWAKLTVSNQNAVLGVGGVSGSMVHYSNTVPWNPVTKKIEIIGMDHNWGRERYAQFDPASNSFVLVSADVGFGAQTRHGYDHTSVNPYTGVVYNRLSDIGTSRLAVRYTNSGSASFLATPDIATAYDQIAIGAAWWSGPFVGAGNQGAFVIFNSGDSSGGANDGQIVAWDPVKNAWIFNRRGMSPNYLTSGSTYHSVIEYSPQKNVAVYGGGNDAPTKLWRLNSDGTFVSMPPIPAGKGVGIQEGNLVNDPVTGNFLLLSARQLWELNPDGSGTWTQKPSPPVGVGTPDAAEGLISAALSDYGVVAYITQTTSTGGTFYLYKNAASGPADTTAPTVSLTAPVAGTVSGTVTITANATDNTGVSGVQFKLDGANLSIEDTVAPYSITWDSTTVTNGTHTLTAVARDAAGNQTTSAALVVSVNNPIDTTPDAFNFTPQTAVAPNMEVTSNTLTPTGYNAATPISISGGSYSVNGGGFVTTAGTIAPGQTVALRLTTSSKTGTQTCATLTIGGVTGSFCAATLSEAQQAISSGPVAYYTFTENAGTTSADLSGNGNTVTLNGAAWSAGKSGTGLAFNGVNGYATVANSASINIAGPITLSFWTNIVDGSGIDYVFLGKVGNGGVAYQYGIEFDANGAKTINLYFRDAVGGLHGPFAMTAPLGVWTHIAYTYDGSVVKGYVDGVLKLTANDTGGIGSSTGNLILGADPNLGQVFKGALDDVRIYNRALALSEIQSDMGSQAPVDTTAPTVNLTAPIAGTVAGTVTLTASATDNTIVAGVQFKLDGANLSSEVTAAPYTLSWNSAAVSNGTHTLTAVARDAAGNQTVSAPVAITVNNPLDTTPDAFVFTPQTGVALSSAATSNTITPTGYNAAAAISVSGGGSYSINGGAFTSTVGTVSPGQTVAVRLTTSASNSTQTCATLTIGGVAGQFCAITQGTAVSGGQDFATRCAQPGVVKCVGFDDVADFNAATSASNSGIFPPSGTTDYTRAVRDTSVKASGGSSLRFTVPSNSPADTSGSYFTNFSDDLSVQFGAGEEFYVQWRQRFSPEFLSTFFTGGYGWKQVIVGTGDQPGIRYYSCSTLELVPTNSWQRGFVQMYNSCTGSASHGPFDGFEQPFGAFDFKLQNARPAPYCLYSQSSTGYFPPSGNCFGYFANEWMTFQMRVQLGPRVGDEFQGSTITLWGAREGQPSEMLIQYGPYNLSAGSLAENQRYGKIWLTPYHTNKDSTQVHPTAYTWYDEVIISRNKIEDPPLSQSVTDSTPDLFSFTAQTGAAPSAVSTSNSIIPSGYNTSAPISVSGGSYSINGGAFVTTAGTINPGQSVTVRLTASGTPATTTTATLTIGGVAGTFSVTTQAAVDTTPDPFSFSTQTGIAPGALVTSNSVVPVGYNAPASISVSAGASYSINSGAFVSAPSTISPGQSVSIRQTSSTVPGATTTVTLTIGGTAGNFSVVTQQAVVLPSAPTAVSAAAAASSVTVTFSAPLNAGTSAITGYAATCTSINGGTAGASTAGPGATSMRVGGLTNGKDYTCTVSASNSVGSGAVSAPTNTVRPFDLTPILNLLLDN